MMGLMIEGIFKGDCNFGLIEAKTNNGAISLQ